METIDHLRAAWPVLRVLLAMYVVALLVVGVGARVVEVLPL